MKKRILQIIIIFLLIFFFVFVFITNNKNKYKIIIEKETTRYAEDYTSQDLDNLNKIILHIKESTFIEHCKYDMNGDEILNISDLVLMNRLLQGIDEKCSYTKTLCIIEF